MSFAPVAIVGRGCVLPGALAPAELGAISAEGRDVIGTVPAGRWGVAPARIYASADRARPDTTWCHRGGYVRGFERVFDARVFAVAARGERPGALEQQPLEGLDPVFLWLLHAGRVALQDAGLERGGERIGAVVGNLSFPTAGMARHAEEHWLQAASPAACPALQRAPADPRNRFMSGLPAHLMASTLSLGAGAYCLDAACASSLYAIKLACDRLHEGSADAMVAGAVNAADDLFLHVGFGALNALSSSGRSRPFHRHADGLLPAEGAALVVLERLDDALAAGRTIHGVIRGIGLCNDGRGSGFLVPSSAGQIRAMQAAYRVAEIDPDEVSWVECHATGTRIGDGAEIASLAEVFGQRKKPLAIGSLKANLGHLITAAAGAGLLRVLESMRQDLLPPTPHADTLHESLEGGPLQVLRKAQPWHGDGRRLAGVSAFGFGGNNAHLIVEAWRPALANRSASTAKATGSRATGSRATSPKTQPVAIAVVAIGARVAQLRSARAFANALYAQDTQVRSGAPGLQQPSGFIDEVALPLKGARFPPRDLQQSLPQQLALLAACSEAIESVGIDAFDQDRTGVVVGMQCDTTVARHGARWRMAEWGACWGASEDWIDAARDDFAPLLGAAGVLGCMPNICANRINSKFDFRGPSFTVSAEELSGVRALQIARRQLRDGSLDIAIVAAADMCAEPAHVAAHAAVAGARPAGDAAIALVLERLDHARAQGHPVLAVLDDAEGVCTSWPVETVERRFGHAHAASGLMQVGAAVFACARRCRPDGQAVAPESGLRVRIDALGGQSATVTLRPDGDDVIAIAEPPPAEGPQLVVAGHLPQPRFPSPPNEAAEVMHGPPTLAPTETVVAAMPALHSVEDGSVPPAVVPSRTGGSVSREPARPMRSERATLLVAPTSPSTVQRLLAQRQRQLAVHQAYLAEQNDAHARFTEQQQRMWQTLVSAPGSAVSRTTTTPPEFTAATPAATTPAAATPAAAAATAHLAPTPTGPTFDKQALRVHASGKISHIFGETFAQQDAHVVQVRMPSGKLLLADRVTGIAAPRGELGEGTVWTETDVRADSWFLHVARMPAGLMIEAGQADLFLISYMGIDFHNRGERAYRLLGCDVTYRRSLPRPGETLRYDIHVDSHAEQGDVRLFFFHYDCHIGDEIVLSVRNGQAGFFSEAELAASEGVLWRAEDQAILADARVDAPAVVCTRSHFDEEQIAAFASGDLFGCFGAGFSRGQTHVRSPSIQDGAMRFIDSINAFQPQGGPWGRGYLRARTAIRPDRWYFDGHFENDPCMPGTLMLEGCLQMMAFFIAGLGYTLDRDGWRFEPLPDHTSKLRCRGQVLPSHRDLVCEIFVEEVHDGPEPILYADLLGTIDGVKAFHARRMALRLVPDWPLSTAPRLEAPASERPVINVDGFAFDYASLMACAWGKPSAAFGPLYTPFDGTRRVARLPGPPYHFMSHVQRIDGPIGGMKTGSTIAIDYDVPDSDWYFTANPSGVMPFAILLEAVLQPCGWLASYVGSALTTRHDLAFRNLDGTGIVHVDVWPDSGTLRTETTLTNIAQTGGMIIESFAVRCHAGDTLIYSLETVFGFFPKEALDNQVGLPTSDAERAALEVEGETFDLRERPEAFFGGALRLPDAPLLMLDRVRGLRLAGGAAGLGSAIGEKFVDPSEWFFKAHFFQDPVQPGSLGIEAMLQLLQLFMLRAGMHEGIDAPRFEALRSGSAMTWKYRGQVVPDNRIIQTSLEILERGRDERGAYAVACASLWVDDKRIYEVRDLGMRIVSTT